MLTPPYLDAIWAPQMLKHFAGKQLGRIFFVDFSPFGFQNLQTLHAEQFRRTTPFTWLHLTDSDDAI